MKFPRPLIRARLIRRYKRFLADVELENGERTTVHTPNTGAMTGLIEPGSTVWLLDTLNPKRKYPLAWEVASTPAGVRVGINTHLANALVQEAIENGVITELSGYRQIRREVKYGQEGSRIDLLLEQPGRARCFVEVKNVTLLLAGGVAAFPDAVSRRGSKHLRELMTMVRQGDRAVLLFCVQREDARAMQPAGHIDAVYARTLAQAMQAGVEVLAYGVCITDEEIRLHQRLPFHLSE